MSLIERNTLLKEFQCTKDGKRIPDFDCDGFQVTIPIKEVKEIILKQKEIVRGNCKWIEDIYGRWHTSCNILADNSPLEYKFCPYCGKELIYDKN